MESNGLRENFFREGGDILKTNNGQAIQVFAEELLAAIMKRYIDPELIKHLEEAQVQPLPDYPEQNEPAKYAQLEKLPDVLTPQQIATYLTISRRRVYELLDLTTEAGGIPSFNIGASRRVDKEDFREWIQARKATELNKYSRKKGQAHGDTQAIRKTDAL